MNISAAKKISTNKFVLKNWGRNYSLQFIINEEFLKNILVEENSILRSVPPGCKNTHVILSNEKKQLTKHTLSIRSGNWAPWSWKLTTTQKPAHRYCIGALFITAKTLKQQRCPWGGGWINKLWAIHTMEYYSGLKRHELSSHVKTRRNLQCRWLSERSPSEKATSCVLPAMSHFGKGTTTETVKWSVAARGSGREGWTGRAQRISKAVKGFCRMP